MPQIHRSIAASTTSSAQAALDSDGTRNTCQTTQPSDFHLEVVLPSYMPPAIYVSSATLSTTDSLVIRCCPWQVYLSSSRTRIRS